MTIYYQSVMGVDLPKSPYIGQVHHDFDLKNTFRYEEKPPELKHFSIVMFGWVDITEKNL